MLRQVPQTPSRSRQHRAITPIQFAPDSNAPARCRASTHAGAPPPAASACPAPARWPRAVAIPSSARSVARRVALNSLCPALLAFPKCGPVVAHCRRVTTISLKRLAEFAVRRHPILGVIGRQCCRQPHLLGVFRLRQPARGSVCALLRNFPDRTPCAPPVPQFAAVRRGGNRLSSTDIAAARSAAPSR